jgi:hypothetical protein
MTLRDHHFVEPTPPFNLTPEEEQGWQDLWDGYEEWTAKTERELETGDAR